MSVNGDNLVHSMEYGIALGGPFLHSDGRTLQVQHDDR